MKKSVPIITVIPSRLDGNRIPMKGMRLLAGKTLFKHTLDSVKVNWYLTESIYINSDINIWGQLAERNSFTSIIEAENWQLVQA